MTVEHSNQVKIGPPAQPEIDDSKGQVQPATKELEEAPTALREPLGVLAGDPEEALTELGGPPEEVLQEAKQTATTRINAGQETATEPPAVHTEAATEPPAVDAKFTREKPAGSALPIKPTGVVASPDVPQNSQLVAESAYNAGSVPGVSLSGALTSSRFGLLRIMLLLTGFALVLWFGRAVLAFLGYRHRGAIHLEGTVLQVTSERSFMGVSLGRNQDSMPISAIEDVRFAMRSNIWSLIAGLGAIFLSASIGTVLLLWGIVGRQPSWVVLGLTVIGCGVLIDALAYLWNRRKSARQLATLAISTSRKLLLLGPVEKRGAERLREALHAALAAKH